MADTKTTSGVLGVAIIAALASYLVDGEVDKSKVEARIAQAKQDSCAFAYIQAKRDSITDDGDTISVPFRFYLPAEVDYRPHYYTVPGDTFRITVENLRNDSLYYIGRIQSDSTGLLHVTARIQPSKPPNVKLAPKPNIIDIGE
jgi:hypothetical protein